LGLSGETGLPTAWNDEEHLVWKTPLPGPGTSSPVIYGDRVFVTCHTGYAVDKDNPGSMDDLTRVVLCLDRIGGDALWKKDVPASLPESDYERRMHWHGYASSTSAVDPDRVYCFFGKSGVYAFDHDGYLFFAHERDGIIYCLDTGTGQVVYEERLPVRVGVIYASPIVADGKLYYVSRQGGTVVLAAEGRFELLGHNRFESDSSVFNASPAVSQGRLFLRSDRFLYCLGVD